MLVTYDEDTCEITIENDYNETLTWKEFTDALYYEDILDCLSMDEYCAGNSCVEMDFEVAKCTPQGHNMHFHVNSYDLYDYNNCKKVCVII